MLKLIPNRFWSLIPRRVPTYLSPTMFRGYPPPEPITGLSLANYNGKIVLGEVLPIPSGVHQIPQQNLSTGIPSRIIIKTSAKYLFPQSNSTQSNLFIKFIPQRSHLLLPVHSCNHLRSSSPAETKNSTPQHQPRIQLPAFVKSLFAQTKIHS